MTSRIAPLVLIFTLSAGLTLALGQSQSSNAGNGIFVASVSGEWVHISAANSKPQPVKFGQPAADADCLYGESGATVVVHQMGQLMPYSCNAPYPQACPVLKYDKNKICSVKIGAKLPNASQGVFSRLTESIENRLREDPDKFMIAASRGLEAEFHEAVVPLRGSQLDLSAVFKEMDGGDYWVALAAVAGNGKPGRPLHLSYKRGMPALVPSVGISPALYNVISVDQNGSPLGTEAWALVCSPGTYASAASEFAQLATASETWPEEMDPSATRAILRAKLDDVAGNRTDRK